jgi:hypothetical protein
MAIESGGVIVDGCNRKVQGLISKQVKPDKIDGRGTCANAAKEPAWRSRQGTERIEKS